MNNALIRDVSDTAFMVATYRAMETARPDALFRDPLAGKIAGEHGRNIVASLHRRARFGHWIIVLRTLVIDELLTAAISEGVETIVNLGAGLDTRPYRMALPRTLQWIEADYPRIIELKETVLSEETPRCRLKRIALDLADGPERRRLFSEIAGRSEKVLILTEGVIPYLTTQEAGALADDLRAQLSFRYWILDYLSRNALRYRAHSEKRMGMENAPFRFDPDDFFAFFEEHGWHMKSLHFIPDEAKKRNRPAPLPILARLWIKLAPLISTTGDKQNFRKSIGYTLLTPAE